MDISIIIMMILKALNESEEYELLINKEEYENKVGKKISDNQFKNEIENGIFSIQLMGVEEIPRLTYKKVDECGNVTIEIDTLPSYQP